MLHDQKVVVVLPAYRAGRTLRLTHEAIPRDVVDEVILVDDASDDDTVTVARQLGITVFVHKQNLGYGGNQKTCYAEALRAGADIVVMVHPDYQYEPRLITAMAAMIASRVYDVVLGSRILGGTARAGGMPPYKYIANRALTLVQNLLLGSKLSEFHTGYRAFSRNALESLPLLANSDDFVFDNEVLAQAIALGLRIGEMSCPTRYFPEASSIDLRRSITYGIGVVGVSIAYRLWKCGVASPRIFSRSPTLRLRPAHYVSVSDGTESRVGVWRSVYGPAAACGESLAPSTNDTSKGDTTAARVTQTRRLTGTAEAPRASSSLLLGEHAAPEQLAGWNSDLRR
jgi:glycosyltransferase involved in cell wall biosynthesis